jgi:sialate O-acetylesterase
VSDWRTRSGAGEFAFLYVQLAANNPARPEPSASRLASFREAQSKCLAVPNSGMAVTIDIGDAKNVHPKNKQDVGARLARVALARTYGQSVEDSGPTFDSLSKEEGAIRLRFKHAGGLIAKDGPLKEFAIAGADKNFVWAEAAIDGESVILKSPAVAAPVAVRYAWADNPEGCNLYNAAGLPAVPFRTDNW